MGLFHRRSPSEIWGIDWSSPELQPINAVSLQTYVQVSQTPVTGGDRVAIQAQQAGVSKPDWTEASYGWQGRIASSRMVANAAQLIMDPEVRPWRNTGVH